MMMQRVYILRIVGVLTFLGVASLTVPLSIHACGVQIAIGIGLPLPVPVVPAPVVVAPRPVIVYPAPVVAAPPRVGRWPHVPLPASPSRDAPAAPARLSGTHASAGIL